MNRFFLAAFLAYWATALPAHSQQRWQFEKLEDQAVFDKATAESREPAPSGIADMLLATGPEGGGIAAAWYALPTSRYRHGALGDMVEGGMLVARREDGHELRYLLPETEVFEDIAPRIADLDGDGISEIVTILSSISEGASIAVFAVSGDVLIRKAATRFLGRAHRWINIAAIESFTGRASREIAVVVTPHIGGTLFFLRYQANSLRQVAAMEDVSNHVFGSPELRLSAVADINDDGRIDLALPAGDRKSLVIVGFTPQGFEVLARARFGAPLIGPFSTIDKPIGVEGSGLEAAFLVGTEDEKYYKTNRGLAGVNRP
jgi:hypothetical protein